MFMWVYLNLKEIIQKGNITLFEMGQQTSYEAVHSASKMANK